ncbi:APC family permease [Bacillota bacterium]
MSDQQITSTSQLNRVLGKKELYGIAFGHVIGSGIFALLGVGIAMTGKSVSVAMLISVIIVLMQALPLILISGTVRLRGGFYTIVGFMWGEKFAGFYVMVYFCANISLAMYALSAADYLQGIFADIPITLTAFIVLTLFYLVNLFGIEGAAKLEIVMDLVMAIALTAFIVFGMPHVNFAEYFSTDDFVANGPISLLSCGVILTWATAGASDMIMLSAEAKNPTKDLPQVIVVATLSVAVFYALISIVASGVLPVDQVAGQPLTLVATTIFPKSIYFFFVIAGALLALTTTLNASFAWVTKPILQASIDGWLPRKLGYIHPKFKTPVAILTIFYGIGLLPIFFGFNIAMIADMTVLLNNILFIFICYGVVFMPKRIPELWAKSKFHCSNAKLHVAALIGGFSAVISVVLLLTELGSREIIGTCVITVIAAIFGYLRHKSGKVDMEISYEED